MSDHPALPSGAQTDHGNMVFKTPKVTLTPKTLEELADTLKAHHAKGTPVTVRNTGHSTNGQTLTDGVQVDVTGLDKVRFDEEAGSVTCQTGARWHDVLGAMRFPSYCTGVFGNNPGQRIRIGGTAAVGGVGFYASRGGGFWNHVRSLKLVTMKGDIVQCSPTVEPELFRYALGGFGRVGVIGELEVAVQPSKPNVLGVVLIYFDHARHHTDFLRALEDPRFDGVVAQEDLVGTEALASRFFGKPFRTIMGMVDIDADDDVAGLCDAIKADYQEDIGACLAPGRLTPEGDAYAASVDLCMKPRKFSKKYIVYFVPREESFWRNLWNSIRKLIGLPPRRRFDPKLHYPWCDCIVDRAHYRDFALEARYILERHGVARYLEKGSVMHGLIDIDSFITFGIKRLHRGADAFPLSLDLPQEDGHALGVAIMPDVPSSKLAAAKQAARELTDLTYQTGGRRYLYGFHELTREQVEQHYGRPTLDTWQKLKDQHDPAHLLNIGVIEHLD